MKAKIFSDSVWEKEIKMGSKSIPSMKFDFQNSIPNIKSGCDSFYKKKIVITLVSEFLIFWWWFFLKNSLSDALWTRAHPKDFLHRLILNQVNIEKRKKISPFVFCMLSNEEGQNIFIFVSKTIKDPFLNYKIILIQRSRKSLEFGHRIHILLDIVEEFTVWD